MTVPVTDELAAIQLKLVKMTMLVEEYRELVSSIRMFWTVKIEDCDRYEEKIRAAVACVAELEKK